MAELLDGSAGSSEQQRGEDSSQGSFRSAAAAAEAEPSALASSSIGFPELVCFCWGVCGRRSLSFCWSAG